MDNLDRGPRFTLRGMVYYAGLIVGIIAVSLVTRPFFDPVISLIGGILCGVGLGFALENAYAHAQETGEKPPPPEW